MDLYRFTFSVAELRILITVYLTLLFFCKGCWCGPDEDRLLKYLFEDQNYRPISRPVLNDSESVEVKFQGSLQQILNLDEKTESLQLSLWLHFRWNDPRLVWNVSDYGGVFSLNFPCENVWLPDIILYNTVLDEVDKRMMTQASASNNGDMIWIPLGIFHSSCTINIQWFPFDTQICYMKFGSWTYGSQFLNLTLWEPDMKMDISNYRPNGEWDLLEASVKRNEESYECCPWPFIDVTFTIIIRRRASYYILNLLVPCALITILSLFNFIQPPEGGEKIGLGITILLSLSVFQLIIADMLPTTSTAVPVIAAHFCAVMALCTLSLIMTILALKFHHTKPNLHRMPNWVRIGICDWLAWCLRMNRPGKPVSKKYLLRRIMDHRLKLRRPKQETTSAGNVELLSFSLTDDDKRSDYLNEVEQNKVAPLDKLDPLPPVEDSSDKSEELQALENVRRELRAVLTELKIMTQKIEEDNIVEDEINEWQYAAIVIDRLCFWVCSVLFTIGTAAIFLIGHFS